MIKWALVFLVIALAAGIFGLSGLAGTAISIAMFLFGATLLLFLVLLALGHTLFKTLT